METVGSSPGAGPVWYPGADRSQTSPLDGGSYVSVPFRGVLHSTETEFWPDYASSNFPHFTVSEGGVRQHISMPHMRAARALRRPWSLFRTIETNRAGAIQIEIVGYRAGGPPLVRGITESRR